MISKTTPRASEAGVTLIEMLVVLALFAVMAGAVVLSLPKPHASTGAELAGLSYETRLRAAVHHALTTGEGFAIWQSDDGLFLLQPGADGKWRLSQDPRLNPVKLSAQEARISFRMGDDRVFSVSPALVPDRATPLRIDLGGGQVLEFNGLNAKRMRAGEPDERAQNR